MKTTLNLDDDLMRDAKALAAKRGVTLTSLVEDALRSVVHAKPPKEKYVFRWKVEKGHALPPVDISDREALYDYWERLEGPDSFPPRDA